MRRSGGKTVVLYVGLLLMALAQPGFAATSETVDGLDGYTPTSGQNIVSATHVSDTTLMTDKFTITLLGAPTDTNYASAYGIFLMTGSGGSFIVESAILGTGQKVDAYLEAFWTYPGGNQTESILAKYYYAPNDYTSFINVSFTHSENGGKNLTWYLPKDQGGGNLFPTQFSWVALTTSPFPVSIIDRTGVAVTPIPNAIWLFGSGVVALVGLKRRKSKA